MTLGQGVNDEDMHLPPPSSLATDDNNVQGCLLSFLAHSSPYSPATDDEGTRSPPSPILLIINGAPPFLSPL